MFYLGTYNQAKYYLDKVNNSEKYNGTTAKWAKIKSSYTGIEEYAILKHSAYTHANMQLVNTLPEHFKDPNLEIDWKHN